MISDRTLIVFSLVVAAAGILALVVIALVTVPTPVAVADVDERLLGMTVVFNAVAENVVLKDGTLFFDARDGNATIDIVMFARDVQRTPAATMLSEGALIGVTGEVALYKGSLEVVAHTLELLEE